LHVRHGSARLGIATYQPQQFQYRWDYLHGLVDTFGLTKSRPWYSWALNAPMNRGTTSPYGNGLDSNAEGTHVIGLKQYELVNHLANVQETISDKKYNKDLNGDSLRDEYRATPIMVYDYYPFGQLMPGRSLDTAGLCVTQTQYTEVPHTNWVNGGPLAGGGGGGAEPYGGIDSLGAASSGYVSGVRAIGATGGIAFTISGITRYYINLQLFFTYLAGTMQVRVYPGTNTSGTQLGSRNVGATSPVPNINLSGVTNSSSSSGTITVVITPVGGATHTGSNTLFSLDSIGYSYVTYTLSTSLYTRCGDPKDKYPFGFNGQMKMNEIAGVGNHNTALFWEYDTRLGRRWNIDPVKKEWESSYATFSSNPIWYSDILGNTSVTTSPSTSSPSGSTQNDCPENDENKDDTPPNSNKNNSDDADVNTSNVGSTGDGTSGGGSNTDPDANPDPSPDPDPPPPPAPDGGQLSWRSFQFTKMTANSYEAGISGLSMGVSVGWFSPEHTFRFDPIFVQFPSSTADGRKYSPEQAAILAAEGFQQAAKALALEMQRFTPSQIQTLSNRAVQNLFIGHARFYLQVATQSGATVTGYQCGKRTIVTPAIWR
jgi:hypothetical protein